MMGPAGLEGAGGAGSGAQQPGAGAGPQAERSVIAATNPGATNPKAARGLWYMERLCV